MVRPAAATSDHGDPPTIRLGTQERAVLGVMLDNPGRILGRRELARLAGMGELSERRCDSVLVGIRRALGHGAIRTVRSRGWMLADDAVDAARALLEVRD